MISKGYDDGGHTYASQKHEGLYEERYNCTLRKYLPLMIWQKVFGEFVENGFWLWWPLEIGLFFHENLDVFFQKGQVDV